MSVFEAHLAQWAIWLFASWFMCCVHPGVYAVALFGRWIGYMAAIPAILAPFYLVPGDLFYPLLQSEGAKIAYGVALSSITFIAATGFFYRALQLLDLPVGVLETFYYTYQARDGANLFFLTWTLLIVNSFTVAVAFNLAYPRMAIADRPEGFHNIYMTRAAAVFIVYTIAMRFLTKRIKSPFPGEDWRPSLADKYGRTQGFKRGTFVGLTIGVPILSVLAWYHVLSGDFPVPEWIMEGRQEGAPLIVAIMVTAASMIPYYVALFILNGATKRKNWLRQKAEIEAAEAERRRYRRQTSDKAKTQSRTSAPPDEAEVQAIELLGLSRPFTLADLKRRRADMLKRVHPDTGGSNRMASMVNEAFDYLKTRCDQS
jgi:hypothetical protein